MADPETRNNLIIAVSLAILFIMTNIVITNLALDYEDHATAQLGGDSGATQVHAEDAHHAGNDIFLLLDKKVYYPGDVVHATLVNNMSKPLYSSVCYTVYRQVGDGQWGVDYRLTPEACISVLIMIPPGGTYNITLNLDGVRPGYYMLSFHKSAVFEVKAPDQPIVAFPDRDYRGGASIPAFIINYYHAPIVILPTTHLEAKIDGRWTALDNLTEKPIIQEPVTLQPGERYIADFTIASPVDGVYDYRVVVVALLTDTNETVEVSASIIYLP